MTAVLYHDWSLPSILISDRDPRFTSSFWARIWHKLGTKLFMTTAYHPQADGQSERTNQTVEIAIRFFVTGNPDCEWVQALPQIQANLNNSRNASTGASPNQLLYGTNTNTDVLTALKDEVADYRLLRQEMRDAAQEAVDFATFGWKERYDRRHKPLRFKRGDRVLLRLHTGYSIPGHSNRKYSNRYAGPFKILSKVGNLAYKLDLPTNFRIHPVVSVAQLKPMPDGDDPYDRDPYPEPGPVGGDSDDDERPWVVERLLSRQIKYEHGIPIKRYLVKWEGWGPAHNVWRSEAELDGAQDLVRDYDARYPLPEADLEPRRTRVATTRRRQTRT